MNKHFKEKLLSAWIDVEATKPDFYESAEAIKKNCDYIFNQNISDKVNDAVANILGHVITMAVLYERVKEG